MFNVECSPNYFYKTYEKYNKKGELIEDGTFTGDINGKKILSVSWSKAEDLIEDKIYLSKKLNKQGLLIEQVQKLPEGIYKLTRNYWKNGKIKNENFNLTYVDTLDSGFVKLNHGKEINITDIVEKVLTDSLKYNHLGKEIYKKTTSPFGNPNEIFESFYTYNKEGLLIEEKEITSIDNKIKNKKVNILKHNNNNDVSEIKRFVSNLYQDSLILKETIINKYKYDSQGNWIESYSFNKNKAAQSIVNTKKIDSLHMNILKDYPFIKKDLEHYTKRFIDYY